MFQTIDFYKFKIKDMRSDFPHMFEDQRKGIEKFEKDGSVWKNLVKEGREN